MSNARWNDDGVSPWRSAGPRSLGDLFVEHSPDPSVADTIALSGSLPVSAYLRPPEGPRDRPYLLVVPRGASEQRPASAVRVSLRDASGAEREHRDLTWDPEDFDKRVELGDAIRALALRLHELRGR